MINVYVLGYGEMFSQVLNAISTFIYGKGFSSLVQAGALVGVILSSIHYLKSRDPMVYGKWFLTYTLITSTAIAPNTSVQIQDLTQQGKVLKVDKVPSVLAIGANILTRIGFGLGESFDMLFSMPDDLKYTQTGMLFASKLMKDMHQQQITDSSLKGEFSEYFKNCIVGDVRLLHRYSFSDLKNSTNLEEQIFSNPSILRRVVLRDGKTYTCKDAAQLISAGITKEMENQTYPALWARLKGDTPSVSANGKTKLPEQYKNILNNYISIGAGQFQGVTDEGTNILRQTLLINAIQNGVRDYQSYADSESGLQNYNFSKTQVQHRNAWLALGEKASWFLPLLHTISLLITLGLFPVVLALSLTPWAARIVSSYVLYFLSLQLWPAIFAIINLAFTFYGKNQSLPYGGLSMANIDSIDQVHFDISAVSGYMMFFIPAIAYGLVSRGIGEALNHNANSINSHAQGSSMAVASEVASGNISVGQSNYMNSSSNNLNANKHDSNWSNLHGMSTEQLSTGALSTNSSGGNHYVDSRGAMSHGALSISDTHGLQHSITKAGERALASVNANQQGFTDSINSAVSEMLNYGQNQSEDRRLGEGNSVSESTSENQAMSRILGVANDVASKTGISQSDALSGLTRAAVGANVGVDTGHSVLRFIPGIKGGVSLKGDASSTSNHSDSQNTGVDSVLSAKEFSDFKSDLQTLSSATHTKHLDQNSSSSQSMLSQIGADLRSAESSSKAYTASLSESERISKASSYVDSNSANISRNLSQELFEYGCDKIGTKAMDELYANSGDPSKMDQLQQIADSFMDYKARNIINSQDSINSEEDVRKHNNEGRNSVNNLGKDQELLYNNNRETLSSKRQSFRDVDDRIHKLSQNVTNIIDENKNDLANEKRQSIVKVSKIKDDAVQKIAAGQDAAQTGATIGAIGSGYSNGKSIINDIKHRLGKDK